MAGNLLSTSTAMKSGRQAGRAQEVDLTGLLWMDAEGRLLFKAELTISSNVLRGVRTLGRPIAQSPREYSSQRSGLQVQCVNGARRVQTGLQVACLTCSRAA